MIPARWYRFAAILSLIAASISVSTAQSEVRVVAGELIVKLTPAADRALRPAAGDRPGFDGFPGLKDLVRRYDVREIEPLFAHPIFRRLAKDHHLRRVYRMTVPASTDVWRMAADGAEAAGIVYAEPHLVGRSTAVPNDTLVGDQYALDSVEAFAAWDVETGDPVVRIAVLDTGVDYNHPDLAAKVRVDLGWDTFDNDADPIDSSSHGTTVAGGAAAATNNGQGVAGLCWGCEIIPVRVGEEVVHIGSVSLAEGILFAALNEAAVITMSLGGQCSALWADMVNFAYDTGVTLVAAAGNNFPAVVYPAKFDRVIGVSAVDRNDVITDFSSTGPAVDLSAPGEDIRVARAGGGYGYGSGTSHATPIVAGVAALVLSRDFALTNAQVRQILRDTADDLGTPGFDPQYGYGRVNARKAVEQASNPPSDPYLPEPDRCGCILEQTVPANRSAELDTLRRFRDEVLAGSAFGREATALYERHSMQMASLLFADPALALELSDLLLRNRRLVDSLLDGDGRALVDPDDVARADRLLRTLSERAGPELRDDLRRAWEALGAGRLAGRPVKELREACQAAGPQP